MAVRVRLSVGQAIALRRGVLTDHGALPRRDVTRLVFPTVIVFDNGDGTSAVWTLDSAVTPGASAGAETRRDLSKR